MKKGSMNRNTFRHVLIFLAMNLCLAGSAQAVAFYVAKQDTSLYAEADVSSEVIVTAERGWALRSSNVDTGADWVEIYMLDPLNNGDWEYVYLRYGLPGKNVFAQRKDVKLVESTLQSGHNVPEFDEKKVSRFGFASLLMGGFLDGKWVDAEHLQGDAVYSQWRIWGGENCMVYGVNGQTGDGVMAALHNEHPGEFDSELQILDAPIFDTQLSDGRILGPETAYLSVSCGWDVMPRRPQILDPDNSIYKNIVKKYLASQGLSDANPQLMQLYRVDLEGDGTDEVIICAQNILTDAESRAQWGNDVPLLVNADSPSEGDYSIVLLRKIVDGKVLDIPLGQFIALRDEADTDSGWSSYRLYKIYQFADLNGDGTLEIILGMRMSEGNAYQIHMVKDGKASMVLENGIYQ